MDMQEPDTPSPRAPSQTEEPTKVTTCVHYGTMRGDFQCPACLAERQADRATPSLGERANSQSTLNPSQIDSSGAASPVGEAGEARVRDDSDRLAWLNTRMGAASVDLWTELGLNWNRSALADAIDEAMDND